MDYPIIKISFIKIMNCDNTHNTDLTGYHKLIERAEQYRQTYKNTKISEVPGVTIARRLFHSINIDPTRYRPSSEALLRRALKSKPYVSINNIVDIGNWCSLDFLLPICVYDADNIVGNVVTRLGYANEHYLAHNNRDVNVAGKFILADDFGPFGAPITDSKRTGVTTLSKNILLTVFASSDISDDKLLNLSHIFAQRIITLCGGFLVDTFLRFGL